VQLHVGAPAAGVRAAAHDLIQGREAQLRQPRPHLLRGRTKRNSPQVARHAREPQTRSSSLCTSPHPTVTHRVLYAALFQRQLAPFAQGRW